MFYPTVSSQIDRFVSLSMTMRIRLAGSWRRTECRVQGVYLGLNRKQDLSCVSVGLFFTADRFRTEVLSIEGPSFYR